MKLAKYSMGVGDRFGQEASAQLSAVMDAAARGISVVPVWNKSNREHTIIGTVPESVREEIDAAVHALGYKGAYYADADHINLGNVDKFLGACDFFTLDVADYIGKPVAEDAIAAFAERHKASWNTPLAIPELSCGSMTISSAEATEIARKYLFAIQEAARIYRHVEAAKGGSDAMVVEVSMDETDLPQTPKEMFLILLMISDEKIPAQTIAPKFTGRFNKGVDYVGDLAQFEQEFNDDLAVIAYAVANHDLQPNLKLSVHSGSDKFSIYPIIAKAIRRFDAGLHLKTAGTTWLEEVIGLAEAGGEGLQIAKDIYRQAYSRFAELSAPYATVIDIDMNALPSPDAVDAWTSVQFTDALRHDQSNPAFNRHFRQMIHVAFKVAAEMGTRFSDALRTHRDVIARNVHENILIRHLLPVFGGTRSAD